MEKCKRRLRAVRFGRANGAAMHLSMEQKLVVVSSIFHMTILDRYIFKSRIGSGESSCLTSTVFHAPSRLRVACGCSSAYSSSSRRRVAPCRRSDDSIHDSVVNHRLHRCDNIICVCAIFSLFFNDDRGEHLLHKLVRQSLLPATPTYRWYSRQKSKL